MAPKGDVLPYTMHWPQRSSRIYLSRDFYEVNEFAG
jgi:hypothetical protein